MKAEMDMIKQHLRLIPKTNLSFLSLDLELSFGYYILYNRTEEQKQIYSRRNSQLLSSVC